MARQKAKTQVKSRDEEAGCQHGASCSGCFAKVFVVLLEANAEGFASSELAAASFGFVQAESGYWLGSEIQYFGQN